jgi:hypothetical protein
MSNKIYHNNFNFYQNANAEASVIKDNFLIRKIEYDIIIRDIRRNHKDTSTQHYLLIGRRGSGKSTLLKRLQVEIDTDSKLSQQYITINPAEEQANMYRLYDLLEEVIRELEDNDIDVGEYNFHEDVYAYTRQLFSMIHDAVERTGKQLLLLLDNIDRILDNVGEDDVHLLREDLLNYNDIKIIGSSTRITEHFWRYDKPFYEFFRVFKLEPLTSEEIRALLLHWSKKMNLPQIEEFVMNKPGQLETIRILTDGLPRTLQFFVNILLTRAPETGYEYLRSIMDSMTPLYQERLNALPPAQRKIVLQMAFIWEAAGAGDISNVTRMENNLVSAQLKQLKDKGIVEKIDTGGRNHLYRLAERFFNLWLIFTQGSPREKRKAKYLTIFLENFYDAAEMKKLTEDHLQEIKDGKMDPNKAAILTKAYAQSRYISSIVRDRLIENTLLMPGIHEELKKQLPPTIHNISKESWRLLKKNEIEKAIELINSIEQTDGLKEYLLGMIYAEMKEYEISDANFQKAVDHGLKGVVGDIANLFLLLMRFDLAEKYALISFSNNEEFGSGILSKVYYFMNKSKKRALDLLKLHLQKNSLLAAYLPAVKAWNGVLEGLEDDVKHLIGTKDCRIGFTLRELLIHHQQNLVYNLFQQKNFGEQLIEEMLPIYYVTQILLAREPRITLVIPPELQEPVERLLKEIQAGQRYYYGNS